MIITCFLQSLSKNICNFSMFFNKYDYKGEFTSTFSIHFVLFMFFENIFPVLLWFILILIYLLWLWSKFLPNQNYGENIHLHFLPELCKFMFYILGGENSDLVNQQRTSRKLLQRFSFQNSSSSPGNQSITISSGSGMF